MRTATARGLCGRCLFARRVSFIAPALLVVSLTLGDLAHPAFQSDAMMRPRSAHSLAGELVGNTMVTVVRQQRTSPTVFVSLSSRGTRAATVFALHGQLLRIYCLVRNSVLPRISASMILSFQWSQGSPPPFFIYPEAPLVGQFSYVYYAVPTAGRYRCDVSANGRPVGSARFTVTP